MSMYANYLKEQGHTEIIENEKGFVTYRFLNDQQVYIVDVYILPDFRRSKTASAFGDQVVELAKKRGCVEVLGTVVPSAPNAAESLKFLMSYGMTPKSSTDNLIVMKKDI